MIYLYIFFQLDATEETLNKYKNLKLRLNRETKMKNLIEDNKIERKVAIKHNIPVSYIRKFKKLVKEYEFNLCIELMSKNLRSEFRKSLLSQLINFIKNIDDTKYK